MSTYTDIQQATTIHVPKLNVTTVLIMCIQIYLLERKINRMIESVQTESVKVQVDAHQTFMTPEETNQPLIFKSKLHRY